MAGRMLRLAAVAMCLVVAPLPVAMIGVCDFIVLKCSHWRFQGARRWGVMMFLNSVMFLVSGLFSPVCAFPLVALLLGVVMSSAFFLSFPKPEGYDEGAAFRSTDAHENQGYIDVEVIDEKDEKLPDRNAASFMEVERRGRPKGR